MAAPSAGATRIRNVVHLGTIEVRADQIITLLQLLMLSVLLIRVGHEGYNDLATTELRNTSCAFVLLEVSHRAFFNSLNSKKEVRKVGAPTRVLPTPS